MVRRSVSCCRTLVPRSAIVLALLVASTPALAQPALERIVKPPSEGTELRVNSNAPDWTLPITIGALSRASGVPMGIETSVLGRKPRTDKNPRDISLTGKTLREALDVLIDLDPRYEWREMDGVVVVRPTAAWQYGAHWLHTPIGPVVLEDVRGADVLGFVHQMLVGRPFADRVQFSDTERFSVETPAGTMLDLLNAAVRTHGEIAWAVEWKRKQGDEALEMSLLLFSGPHGTGMGVPSIAFLQEEITARVARAARPPDASATAILDRVVGTRHNGQPVETYALAADWAVTDLAESVQAPMGIERAAPKPAVKLTLTGLTVRAALDAIVAADPRYEWRELDGTIVIRPIASWNEPAHPLSRPVRDVRFDDVHVDRVIAYVASALGSPQPWHNQFPDSRRVTIDMPQGTVLDLLNAMARAHGQLTWSYNIVTDRKDRAEGRRHHLAFSVFGGGGLGLFLP